MGYGNYGKVGSLPGINCDDAAFFPAFASPEERRFRGIAIFLWPQNGHKFVRTAMKD